MTAFPQVLHDTDKVLQPFLGSNEWVLWVGYFFFFDIRRTSRLFKSCSWQNGHLVADWFNDLEIILSLREKYLRSFGLVIDGFIC